MSVEVVTERKGWKPSPPVICAPIFVIGLSLAGWSIWQSYSEIPTEEQRIVDQTNQCQGLNSNYYQIKQIGEAKINDTNSTIEDLARDPSARMLIDCYRFARKPVIDHGLGPGGWRTEINLFALMAGLLTAGVSGFIGWSFRND